MKQATRKVFLLFVSVFFLSSTRAQSVGGTTAGAATYCSTTNSGFVTVSGYTGSILNWQSSTDGGITWSTIANTTANQTYFNLAQTTCYQAVVQNGLFPPDTSTTVCITIYPASVGGTLSGGGTFCAGTGPGSITLAGYTGNILYWQSSTNGGATWSTIANTTPVESYLNITTSTLYWAIVQNGPTCPTDTSTQVSFTVSPATVPGSISGAASVCSTANAGILTLSGYTGSVIGWSSSTTGGPPWTPIANTTPLQSYFNLPVTTYYHAIVQSGTCPPDSTADVVMTVSPPTVAGTITGGGLFCGVPATGTLTLAGYTGSITGWISSTTSGASWTSIANTTPTENYTTLPTTTWYTVIVQSGGCPADTANIEIVDVAPNTVAGTISASTSVCPGINNDSLLLTGNVGSVLGWISSTDGGVTWTPIANTTTTQLYSGLTTTTMYAAIVQSGSCAIDTATAVTVSVFAPFAVFAGNDTTILLGQTAAFNGVGSGIPFWSPGATLNNPNIFTPVATPATTTTYTLFVTDINGCVNSDDIVVTVTLPIFNGIVSNLFTPNGDGTNDFWYIQNIQNFPDNEVLVYNIYGDQVYEKKGYNNDWAGTYNGADLPDGTYFYVLRFDKSSRIVKGSIDILRK
ncbi:MAG: gliding motility-associated C-terminal domain-containing protein [Bacteroidia bacterium]